LTSARRLVLTPRSACAKLGEADADERSLKGRPREREIGRLHETAFDDVLGLAASPLRPFQVDFRGHIGHLGQDHDAVRPNLEEAAEDGERLFLPAALDAKHALAEGRDKRGMVREDAKLAFAARDDDLVHVAFEGSFLRRDDFEMQRHYFIPRSSKTGAARRTTLGAVTDAMAARGAL
jgi:hypothetical protein